MNFLQAHHIVFTGGTVLNKHFPEAKIVQEDGVMMVRYNNSMNGSHPYRVSYESFDDIWTAYISHRLHLLQGSCEV